MDDRALRAFGERYARAWCSQDPAQVAAFFSPGGSLTVNGGTPNIGREGVAQLARVFMRDFPDMRVAMDRIVRVPGGAEFHWTLTGTNTGPGGTGRSVRISGYEEWQFASDGLVGESQGHFDAAEYDRQIRGASSGS
jgi:uncharacterized protein (TIGR02246 family)